MKTSVIVRIGLLVLSVLLSLGMVTSIHAASLSGSALQQKKSTPASPATPGQSSPSIAPPPSSTVGNAGKMKKEMMKKVGKIIVDSTTWEYGAARIQAKLVDLAGMPMRNKTICEGKKIDWVYYEQQQSGGLAGMNLGDPFAPPPSPYQTLSNCAVTDSVGRAIINLTFIQYMQKVYPWTPGTHAVYMIYNPPQSKEYAIGSGNILITRAKLQLNFSNPYVEYYRDRDAFKICGKGNRVRMPNSIDPIVFPVEINWSPGSPAGPVTTLIKPGETSDAFFCFDWALPGGTVPGQPRQFQFRVKHKGSEYYLPAETMFNMSENAFKKNRMTN